MGSQKIQIFLDLQIDQAHISLWFTLWEISNGTILKIHRSDLKLWFFFQINHAQVPKKSKLLFVLRWLGSICQCVVGGKRFSLTHRFQKSNGCALFLVCVGPTLYHGKGRKRSQSTFALTGPSQSTPKPCTPFGP